MDTILAAIDAGVAFDVGDYAAGQIPTGEYAFIGLQAGNSYYSEEDSTGEIIDNEIFDTFGYVWVWETGKLTTRGVLIKVDALPVFGIIGAKRVWENMNDKRNYFSAGWYKVGVDLPAGTYILIASGAGYGAVMSGPIGKTEIVENLNFSGSWQVTVKNGQYLHVARADIRRPFVPIR